MSTNILMGIQVMGYGLAFVFFSLIVFYVIVLFLNKLTPKGTAEDK